MDFLELQLVPGIFQSGIRNESIFTCFVLFRYIVLEFLFSFVFVFDIFSGDLWGNRLT